MPILDDDSPFAGRRPGAPALEPVLTRPHAPTPTSLSFNVACARGGRGPVTDYVLFAENVANPSEFHEVKVAAPDNGAAGISGR